MFSCATANVSPLSSHGGDRPNGTAFQIMTKPGGAICNLDCAYRYLLSKELPYSSSRFRLADKLLERYTHDYIDAQCAPEVTFAWNG